MAIVKCKCPDKRYGNWYIGRDCQNCKEQVRAYYYRNNEYIKLPMRRCVKCGTLNPLG